MGPEIAIGVILAAVLLSKGKDGGAASSSAGASDPGTGTGPNYAGPGDGGDVAPGGAPVSVTTEGGTATVGNDGAGHVHVIDTGNEGTVDTTGAVIGTLTGAGQAVASVAGGAYAGATAPIVGGAVKGAVGVATVKSGIDQVNKALGITPTTMNATHNLTPRDKAALLSAWGPVAGSVW
jgi:hypothetical protein